MPADEFDEQTWLPATNRDQSCAFCWSSRPRFAHRLDPKRVQFRIYGKGASLPTFWTVCDRCEAFVANGDDEELLRLMLEKDEEVEADRIEEQVVLTTFRAADLGATPLADA